MSWQRGDKLLKLLHIKNFALIEDMEVEFDAGFNVITGETGAGKTILLNAIKVALGERAHTEYIRAGAKKALVQAAFQVESSFISDYLSDLGIELSDEDMLVFSREINSNGRSLCRINGQVVTLSFYKRAASQMMDMHSQHQQSVMLTKEHHIELLDAYSEKVLKQRDIVKRCYHEWKKKHEMLEELKSKTKDTARQIDLIKFQVKEIESANLEPNEDEALTNEKKMLNNAEKITLLADTVYKNLYSGDGECRLPAVELISESITALSELLEYDESLSGQLKSLEEAMYVVEDVAREVVSFKDKVEYDANRLNYVEMRLSEIEKLKKKYGDSVSEILEYHKKLLKQLEDLSFSEENIENLKKETDEKLNILKEEAKKLSLLRQKAADELKANILKELKDLGMEKVQFEVGFDMKSIADDGLDDVQFLISANPGEPLKPLHRIASGGELSRFMLALKRLFSNKTGICTMIFDELDTGVGGNILYAVAKKMFQISRHVQVIAVTHSPQVAGFADAHFLIKKQVVDGSTYTKIFRLNEKERLYELARMLGSKEEKSAALSHAREILEVSRKLKEN